MPVAVADHGLYNIVSAPGPTTIAQIIDLMQQIDELHIKRRRPKVFNRLYLGVSRQVDLEPVVD